MKKWEKFPFPAEDTASAKAPRQNGIWCVPGRKEGCSQRGESHEGRAERQTEARPRGHCDPSVVMTYSKSNGLSKG